MSKNYKSGSRNESESDSENQSEKGGKEKGGVNEMVSILPLKVEARVKIGRKVREIVKV